MTLLNKIKAILEKIQVCQASHQQQIKVLKQYYEKESLEDFFESITCILRTIFSKSSLSNQNTHVERVIDFLASFVADVTPDESSTNESFSESDDSSHLFLTMIIKEALKYHNLTNEYLRYNSCLFIKLILKHIGDKTLDNEVCDLIQEALLDRTLDPKSSVRMQAVLGLRRLQDPIVVPECPVINSYLSLIVDPNAQIRAEVVSCIAPKSVVIIQIVRRLQDVDPNVRIAAFRRCADFEPKQIRIIERQHILQCGLMETHPKVKNVFTENLLPKWINEYNNNYINFLKGLKLDADENDITNTENITRDVINLLLSTSPINEISSSLPITEEKIIEVDKLTSEAAALWNLLVSFLRRKDDDYIEEIIPNLTPFCNYIQRIVKERGIKVMEDWEFLDYQYILNNLFSMVDEYDLSDEVGRRTLHQLTLELLRTENLEMKLKKKIVALAKKSSQETEDFTTIICTIISDIREPVIEKTIQINPADELNKNYEKAKLKVDIISLEGEQEDALIIQDYLKGNELKIKINELKEKLHELTTDKPATEMVRVIKDDPKTICDCLEILISLLQLPMITEITPSLMTVKDEFVLPLLNSNISDINWRVLECISLFCSLDQHMAEEYIKVLCIPIITYRVIPNYNKHALLVSIKAISDLVRLFGVTVFDNIDYMKDDTNGLMNITTSKRRLYSADDLESTITNRFRVEAVVEIILDMLDDELSDIRDTALEAISKLILDNFPVSSLLVSRLILKWYNPLTVKSSDKLEQLIGGVLGYYAQYRTGAKEVIAKAIIPTLHSIASAPATSPLVDVDVDNLLLFLSTITNSDSKMDSGTHLNMAHMFIYEITKTKESLMILYLSKILLQLDINTENVSVIKELIGQVDTTLEHQILDKNAKRNIQKFKEKLLNIIEIQNKTRDIVIGEKSVNLSSIVEEDEPQNSDNLINTDNNVDNNQLEKGKTLPEDRLENKSNGAKKLSNKKKRRNRKTTKTSSDEEEQQINKRLKVVLNDVGDNTKQIETTKDPEGTISSSNSDVINATPEDELIEKLNVSKRKRFLAKNKTDGEASSDSDSIGRRKRKSREKARDAAIESISTKNTITDKNNMIASNLQRKRNDFNTNSESTNSDVENSSVRNGLRSSKIVSEIQVKVGRKNGNYTKSDTTNTQQEIGKGSTLLKNKKNPQLRSQKKPAKKHIMVTNSSTNSGNSKKVSNSSNSESSNDKMATNRRGRSRGSDQSPISSQDSDRSNRSLKSQNFNKKKETNPQKAIQRS